MEVLTGFRYDYQNYREYVKMVQIFNEIVENQKHLLEVFCEKQCP